MDKLLPSKRSLVFGMRGVLLLVLGVLLGTGVSTTVSDGIGPPVVDAADHDGGGTRVDCDSGDNLQSAINSAASGDTLEIEGTCVGTFTIDKDLKLRGDDDATLDANGSGTVVTISSGNTVVLEDLTITGGAGTGSDAAGGILNSGSDLTLIDTKVTENSATSTRRATGGIRSRDGGPLTLIDSEVSRNNGEGTVGGTLSNGVGGIQNFRGGTLTIRDSLVDRNTGIATGSGLTIAFGGVHNGRGGPDSSIIDSTISNNTARTTAMGASADSRGTAGVISAFTTTTIENTVVKGNSIFSITNGTSIREQVTSGVLNLFGTVIIKDSQVTDNTAEGPRKVGTVTNVGVLTVEDSVIADNTSTVTSATGFAIGGIHTGFLGTSTTTLVDSAVTVNVALSTNAGTPAANITGGLHNFPAGTTVLIDSEVEDNEPNQCNFVDPAC